MWIQTKICDRCKETVYGSREREVDGYRTWWDSHECVPKQKETKRKRDENFHDSVVDRLIGQGKI